MSKENDIKSSSESKNESGSVDISEEEITRLKNLYEKVLGTKEHSMIGRVVGFLSNDFSFVDRSDVSKGFVNYFNDSVKNQPPGYKSKLADLILEDVVKNHSPKDIAYTIDLFDKKGFKKLDNYPETKNNKKPRKTRDTTLEIAENNLKLNIQDTKEKISVLNISDEEKRHAQKIFADSTQNAKAEIKNTTGKNIRKTMLKSAAAAGYGAAVAAFSVGAVASIVSLPLAVLPTPLILAAGPIFAASATSMLVLPVLAAPVAAGVGAAVGAVVGLSTSKGSFEVAKQSEYDVALAKINDDQKLQPDVKESIYAIINDQKEKLSSKYSELENKPAALSQRKESIKKLANEKKATFESLKGKVNSESQSAEVKNNKTKRKSIVIGLSEQAASIGNETKKSLESSTNINNRRKAELPKKKSISL